MKKKVTIVQRRLTHYRVTFFELLKSELECRGIELQLLIGVGTSAEDQKLDSGKISWAIQIPTRYLFNNKLCWQPVHRYLSDTDLVIVTQENALLANQLMLLTRRSFKLAFWGHGGNFQSQKPDGFKERYKRWSTKRADWFFAYTQLSADLMTTNGYPADNLTIVNNSIDTSKFSRQLESLNVTETQSLKESIGFTDAPVGVFIGSLYANKRLNFLFSAIKSIRTQLDTFQFIFVGDGPERNLVQSFCEENPWAYWAGVQCERNKAIHISTGQIMLNPGLVGLGILDSFVSKVPMLTTNCGVHSPEIAYMDNWYNGVITADNIDDYVNAAIKLLESPDLLNSLRDGCGASAELFTIENMVHNFANGVTSALMSEVAVHY